MTAPIGLSKRQAELLERVCLKRYTVAFTHYMGNHQPNESVRIDDATGDTFSDFTFRPTTVYALHSKGLVQFKRQAHGFSHILPTRAGLDYYQRSKQASS